MNEHPKPGHVPQTYPTFAFTAMGLFLGFLGLTVVYKIGEGIASLF